MIDLKQQNAHVKHPQAIKVSSLMNFDKLMKIHPNQKKLCSACCDYRGDSIKHSYAMFGQLLNIVESGLSF